MITLQRHEISADIINRYATVVYLFDFENTNESRSNELKFELTIDPNAFIAGFQANIDGILFVGQTKEKEQAAKEYKAAKQKNENAILISQPHKDIPNVFQIKTNIDAKSKVTLSITIQQYLQKKLNFNELTVEILRNFSKYGIRPNFDAIELRLSVSDDCGIYDVQIANGDQMKTIKNEMSKDGKTCEIEAQIGSSSNINDLRLQYKVKGEEQESNLLFDENTGTFCHIISDALSNAEIDGDDNSNTDEGTQSADGGKGDNQKKNSFLIPRCVVFVLDRSGSMYGSKWEQCISSTILAIKSRCFVADEETTSLTIKILKQKRTGGATNIDKALQKAIQLIQSENAGKYGVSHDLYMNQIIFITDGEPNRGETNTNQIALNVKNANKLDGDKNIKISIFSFGVGREGNDSSWIEDLNHSFLKILSVNNNGFYYRIKQTTADVALAEYFNILSNPILSRIHVQYRNKNISELTNCRFNTLYAGNDLIICGKINGIQQDDDYNLEVAISGTTGLRGSSDTIKVVKVNKKMSVNVAMSAAPSNDGSEGSKNTVERICAYLKLQEFANRELVFSDMIELDDDEKSEQDAGPMSLAMKYKFVTPWTSMIVVKKKEEKEAEQETKEEQDAVNTATSTQNITQKNNGKQNEKQWDLDKGDALMDDIGAAMDQVNEMNEAMSRSLGHIMDDNELEAELAELEEMEADDLLDDMTNVKGRFVVQADLDSDVAQQQQQQMADVSPVVAERSNVVHNKYHVPFNEEPDDSGIGGVAESSDDEDESNEPSIDELEAKRAPKAKKKNKVQMEKEEKVSKATRTELDVCSVDQMVYLVMNVALKDAKSALYAYRDLMVKYLKDNNVDGGTFVMLAKQDNNKKLFNELKSCIAPKDDKLDAVLQEFIDGMLILKVSQILNIVK